MAIYGVILAVIWFLFVVYWFIASLKVKKNVSSSFWMRGAGLRLLLILLVLLLLHIPSLRTFIDNNIKNYDHSLGLILGNIGIVLTVLGLAFAVWARVYLGRNWGMPMTLKQEPELITSGPYVYIRHPIYTGILLACLGTTLVVGVLWLIPLVLFSIYFSYSARIEEKNLLEQFPDTYPSYMQKTKVLLPFIY